MALGICTCSKHGRSGWDEVCEHLNAELNQGIYGPFHYIRSWAGVRVCEKCWQDYNMEYYETHPDIADKDFFDISEESPIFDEYHNEVYEKLKRGGRCLQCLAEIEVNQARRNGIPDPFAVYEKTLGANDDETIAALRHFLVSNFHFAQSAPVLPPFSAYWDSGDHLALFINHGAYTFPLIIKVYYVTIEAEQEHLLQLIREFLGQQTKNQAKVMFYEAEIWELRTNPEFASTTLRKGAEKLLRKVWLNCAAADLTAVWKRY